VQSLQAIRLQVTSALKNQSDNTSTAQNIDVRICNKFSWQTLKKVSQRPGSKIM